MPWKWRVCAATAPVAERTELHARNRLEADVRSASSLFKVLMSYAGACSAFDGRPCGTMSAATKAARANAPDAK